MELPSLYVKPALKKAPRYPTALVKTACTMTRNTGTLLKEIGNPGNG